MMLLTRIFITNSCTRTLLRWSLVFQSCHGTDDDEEEEGGEAEEEGDAAASFQVPSICEVSPKKKDTLQW